MAATLGYSCKVGQFQYQILSLEGPAVRLNFFTGIEILGRLTSSEWLNSHTVCFVWLVGMEKIDQGNALELMMLNEFSAKKST